MEQMGMLEVEEVENNRVIHSLCNFSRMPRLSHVSATALAIHNLDPLVLMHCDQIPN